MTDRAAFLAARKQGVGGSDIASLFNQGYGCRRRLFYDKTNTPEDFPCNENLLMELGQVLEPYFAERYAKGARRSVLNSGQPQWTKEVGALRVNVDRLVAKTLLTQDEYESRDFDRSALGVLEIKSVGRAAFYKYKREGLPADYIWQLQAGMLASGLSWGSFAIGCRDNGELLHWDVERNETLCNEIKIEVPRFWSLVVDGIQDDLPAELLPNRLSPDDSRCQRCEFRTTCQGNALINIPVGSEYVADESLAPLVQEYVERRSLKKQAEELLNETKAELECRLGDRGMVTAAGAKIQFYEITKKTYTVAEHKERPLRIYEAKKR